MATTNAEIVAIAQRVADCATKLTQANVIIGQVLERNTGEAFDWSGADEQAANDALVAAGLDYTAAEVSNVIGSMAAFQTFWTTHGGNIRKMTAPIV